MKKVFKFMMMALVAIVMSAGFAACSSSDDDNNNTPQQPEQPKTYGFISLHFEFSEDLLEIANVTVTYTAEDGTTKTEAITTTKFDKEVTYTKDPGSAKYALKFNLKENFADKDTYHILIDNSNTTGTAFDTIFKIKSEGNFAKDKLKSILENYEEVYKN